MSERVPIPLHGDEDALRSLRELRREFHRHPETMWTEFWTTARICRELRQLGFDIRGGRGIYDPALRMNLPEPGQMEAAYAASLAEFGEEEILPLKGGFTGAIAERRFGTGGPRIGFRFDIDALPIRESPQQDHLPARDGFASTNGNMHACGHDAHITIGLGLARRLDENANALNADVVLLFQPAEEGGLGGRAFSTADALAGLDYLFAVHVGLTNRREIICGVEFLSSTQLEVEFGGRSAHAANAPHEGRNALLAAATAVTGIYAIPRHSGGATRVNVGRFRSDNAVNVISDHARFSLEVRGDSDEVCRFVEERAREVIDGACIMNGTTFQLRNAGTFVNAPSSPELREAVRAAAIRAGVPDGAIVDRHRIMACEDATYIMRRVLESGGKAAFVGLGSPTYGGHHNPAFDFDEDLLLWGVDLFFELTRTLCSSGNQP